MRVPTALHEPSARPSNELERASFGEELRLVRAAAGGDADAGVTVARRVERGVHSAVRRVLGRAHPELDDITQEAMVALLRALPHFRGEAPLGGFAYRVALLTAITHLRKLRARIRNEQDYALAMDEIPLAVLAAPDVDALARQRREVILRLLGELPEPIAEAVALHFAAGHTVASIASSSGVSKYTVEGWLRRGKRALRRRLERNATWLEAASGQES